MPSVLFSGVFHGACAVYICIFWPVSYNVPFTIIPRGSQLTPFGGVQRCMMDEQENPRADLRAPEELKQSVRKSSGILYEEQEEIA